MRTSPFIQAVVMTVCLGSAATLWMNSVATAKLLDGKTRLAIVGLDHDHVWELLRYIDKEPDAELVAIAESRPGLVKEAKSKVPDSVKFYAEYVAMLDEAKPDAVI